MGKMISISEASKLTGVTVKTLKIWDNEGLLKAKYKNAIQKSIQELEKERDENSENNDTSSII
ncbi:MAG: MerR family DNA-binding transcriptional regulator [Clostridia bacterium]|nr:MerR family DNA-binding transcriptional regulator [Clostridia bacterium]